MSKRLFFFLRLSICNCYTESFSCSFYVSSEWCYSVKKIEIFRTTGSSMNDGRIKRCYSLKSWRNIARLGTWSFCQPLKTWLVQAMNVTDNIKKKNGKTLARWSYHCHLPRYFGRAPYNTTDSFFWKACENNNVFIITTKMRSQVEVHQGIIFTNDHMLLFFFVVVVVVFRLLILCDPFFCKG